MKKLIILTLIFGFGFFSCENEKIDNQNANGEAVLSSSSASNMYTNTCTVSDVDNCYSTRPDSNFWWPKTPDDFNNGFFQSKDGVNLTFTENPTDGTAHISGSTSGAGFDCLVKVDVYLKGKMNYTEWIASGGDIKVEGCSNAKPESFRYYVIDSEKSSITATGSGCIAEGTYKVEQRPDPTGDTNYGVFIGPGGHLFDSAEPDAIGLSGWGWILNAAGERAWVLDFNFKLDCKGTGTNCDTAFAIGNNNNPYTCFIDDAVLKSNRWGWVIGPLAEGTIQTYKVYAGAGQCDISKGAYVGTVDVSYVGGNVNVTYNIIDGYELRETHVYAGNAKYPVDKKGKATVAPGQYTIGENLSGNIYVIAHAVVCN